MCLGPAGAKLTRVKVLKKPVMGPKQDSDTCPGDGTMLPPARLRTAEGLQSQKDHLVHAEAVLLDCLARGAHAPVSRFRMEVPDETDLQSKRKRKSMQRGSFKSKA